MAADMAACHRNSDEKFSSIGVNTTSATPDAETTNWGHMKYHGWQVALLLASSFAMIGAGVAGFVYEEYIVASLVLLAGVCSVNYWRRPGKSWRRIADFAAAAPITLYVFVGGIWFQPTYGAPNIVAWASSTVCYFCYRRSFELSATTSVWWAPWHAGGHICLAVGTGAAIAGHVDRFLLAPSLPTFNPIALLGYLIPGVVIVYDNACRPWLMRSSVGKKRVC